MADEGRADMVDLEAALRHLVGDVPNEEASSELSPADHRAISG